MRIERPRQSVILLCTMVFLSCRGLGEPAPALDAESPQRRDERMHWWRDARFGMFVHWGLYAVPAGEWKGLEKEKDLWGEWIMERAQIPVAEYEQLAKRFNPARFDASEWAKIIRRSGMRYLVITAKHCDGFAMFKSRASRYNIVDATPFARDPMAELATALPKEDLRLGFYYSHCWDWHEPDALGHDNRWDFPDRSKKQVERYLLGKSMPQVNELVAQYRPSLIWFDVPSDITRDQSAEFVRIIRSAVPDCIINERVGNGLGDYSTPEQYIPRLAPGKDFEVCMTLNEHWGFDRNDRAWKPAGQVIAMLAEIAGKGGNFLLNVGPTAEGLIPQPAVDVLEEVGDWMRVNGESIYGTRSGPLPECHWGWCTAKPPALYLHVLRWPTHGRLFVPGLRSDVRAARLLSDTTAALKTERASDRDWIIHIPTRAPDARDTVVALDIGGNADVDGTLALDPLPGASNRFGCWSSEIHGRDARRRSLSLQTRAHDHIGSWTNSQDWVSWAFRAPMPATYEAAITYSADPKSIDNEFVIQIGDRTLSGKAQDTGGTNSFKEFSLGAIVVPRNEGGTIALKPKRVAVGSTLMQFHALTLRAIKESPENANQ